MKKFSFYNPLYSSRKKLQPLICLAAGFAAPNAGYREKVTGGVKAYCGIFWCSSGSAKFDIDGRSVRLFSGDAVCYCSGNSHCIEVENSGFSYHWAVWDGVLAEAFLSASCIVPGEKIHLGESLKEDFDLLYDTLRENSVKASCTGGVILDGMLTKVALAFQGEKTSAPSGEYNLLIGKFKDLVLSEFHDPAFNLDAMSSVLGVHRSTIDRAVRQHFNISPGEYLQDIRIKAALGGLKSSVRPVKEIGYACGFSNPSYFSRVVKSKTGMSPKEYREKG